MVDLKSRAEKVKRKLADPVAAAHALGLETGQRNGAGVMVKCPWHGETQPSCSLRPRDNGFAVRCFGCGHTGTVLDLVARVHGLELRGADFARVVELGEQLAGIASPGDVRPPELDDFAHERHLPIAVLQEFGVRPVVHNRRPGLRYVTPVGIDRIKFTDNRKPKYTWAKKGGRAHLYGVTRVLEVLRAQAAAGVVALILYIVNGEPSVWACVAENVAAVCLCGGEGTAPTAALVAELVAELKKLLRETGVTNVSIRVVYDTDTAGGAGAPKVVTALRTGGFADVNALDLAPALPDVAKGDVDDLHRRVGDQLATALAGLPPLDDRSQRAALSDQEGLPRIVVNGRPLRDKTNDALQALIKQNDPPNLFVRARRFVRVCPDEDGRPIIDVIGENELRGVLSRRADFVSYNHEADAAKPVSPPIDVVRDVLALGCWPSIPPLTAVVEMPVLRPNGTVVDKPGYDPSTRLIYAPAPGLIVPHISANPGAREIDVAVDLLLEVICDFPFGDHASAANTLGFMLTPPIRPRIRGGVPLALLDKPKAGTGASLLAEVVALIAAGRPAAMMGSPKDEEEWRKQITSVLLDGTTFINIDNVTGTLRSAALSRALTALRWKDRILGRTEVVELPQRATWSATGNNVRLGGDIARRAYRVRLNARMQRPWKRKQFKHPNLLEWVAERRADILAALLTVARAYFAAGRPKADVPEIGGFTDWAQTVGGALAYVGIRDFLGNLDTLHEELDEEESSWTWFVAALRYHFGDRPFTTAEVAVEVAGEGSTLRDAFPVDLAAVRAENPDRFSVRLGQALRARVDTVYGEGCDALRLEQVRGDAHAKVARWRIAAGVAGVAGVISTLRGSGNRKEPKEEKGSASGNGDGATPASPATPASEVASSNGAARDEAPLDSAGAAPINRHVVTVDDVLAAFPGAILLATGEDPFRERDYARWKRRRATADGRGWFSYGPPPPDFHLLVPARQWGDHERIDILAGRRSGDGTVGAIAAFAAGDGLRAAASESPAGNAGKVIQWRTR